METNNQHENSNNHDGDKRHDKHKVIVKVDKKEYKVQKGNYKVSDFKILVGVDASKELDEIIKGTLTPLSDDAKINIQGGEIFISHVRAGGSS